jgi:hypothetical protein
VTPASPASDATWHVVIPAAVVTPPGKATSSVLGPGRQRRVGEARLHPRADGTTLAVLTLREPARLEVEQGYVTRAKPLLVVRPDGNRLVGLELGGWPDDDPTTVPLVSGANRPASPIPARPEVNLDPIPAGPIPGAGVPFGPRPRVLSDRLDLEG